jgi:hypothetical protein
MNSDKEKAKEVLKERERARKGFAVTDDEGKDPLDRQADSIEEQEEREKKVDEAGLALGLGLNRTA